MASENNEGLSGGERLGYDVAVLPDLRGPAC